MAATFVVQAQLPLINRTLEGKHEEGKELIGLRQRTEPQLLNTAGGFAEHNAVSLFLELKHSHPSFHHSRAGGNIKSSALLSHRTKFPHSQNVYNSQNSNSFHLY